MKYLYLVNLSVMTNITLYSTFIRGCFNFSSFTMKLSAILDYNCNGVSGNFSNLYSLW